MTPINSCDAPAPGRGLRPDSRPAGRLYYAAAMCGRFDVTTDAQAMIDFFEIEHALLDPDIWQARYNVAPSQDVAIVRDRGGGRELLRARWGLVPHWSKEEKPKYSTINARAETVADKPVYREPFRHKRCLIPATGYYEWRQQDGGKTPYHIQLPERGLFAFAGLWDRWEHGDKAFESCTIIVTAANGVMRPIHERMPVILNPAQYNTWLNTAHFNQAQLQALLAPFGGTLEAYEVSRYVNSPGHDDVRCIERVG